MAERIIQFYQTHPTRRIVTELVSHRRGEVVFRASVYRESEDSGPAATGWASEREGDGDVNAVACLENTETSAVGRALANLGFTASRMRPSAEEMAKAARARARLAARPVAVHEPVHEPVHERAHEPAHSPVLADLLALLTAAERAGLRPARVAAWRARLTAAPGDERDLLRVEQRLRRWIARQRAVRTA